MEYVHDRWYDTSFGDLVPIILANALTVNCFLFFFLQKTFIYIILHFITFIITKHNCSIHNARHKPLSNTKIHN